MSSKREEMRRKAKQELHKKGKDPVEKANKKPEQPPSKFSSFLLILMGSLTTFFFISLNEFVLGIFAGLPFIIIGTYRLNKASLIESKAANRANL